jgi:glycosyltransferase involved in cell wall biosynthesis
MRVLFLFLSYPDMTKSFNMFTTLVEKFTKNGHETYVLAPGTGTTRISYEKGVNVVRVNTLPLKSTPNYIKGFANFLLPNQFEASLNRFYKDIKFDLIISATPPVTFVDLITRLKKKHGAKFYLILRDIFPQGAIDLGIMRRRGIAYKYFRNKERKLYKSADFIGCMSEGNVHYLLEHNPHLERSKLHVLKNFQVLNNIKAFDREKLKKEYGFEGKFIAVFGGNMGKPQQLENVIELAKSCVKYSDVIFLLLGEGQQMQQLSQLVKSQNIANIMIRDTIPKQDFQNLVSICDIGLISLHKDFTIPNIPSKTLDYFNLGIPVLASIDKSTDYGRMLDEAEAGLWSIACDHANFLENFDRLYQDPLLRYQMGKNGRRYFEKNLTPEIAYKTILSIVEK